MGKFKAPKKFIVVDFVGHPDLEGLEVKMRKLNIGQYLKVAASATDGTADVEPLLTAFADNIVEWNLEDDDDQPVPTDLDGVKSLDLDFVMPVITSWMKAIAGVAAPLESGSNSGETALEASMSMETL